ncbi:cysteine desulfurase family protein [Parafrankia sp. BMG5.11]|uniref:cysteine desulfurase family protein n=1 Tax=Parafrankia sp. BMG5.11 TaxID=222540 RepID=UPI00103C9F1F|nr:aminotransferase class V-fold PLP-dependent enzyme [Parafrankia sp. BMG5.11]TCJ38284.1 aminotransferase class V-fold PLP-dependent enzyme [Parafrankia sp. BMG5.11]
MTNPRIYLDHAAATPLRPEARAAMEQGFALWANPSSPHAEGRKARAALEDARERVKAALEWEGEVIFTSGASEAAALALDAVNAVHDIASAVEHDAVLRGDRPEWTLPVRHDGAADLLALSAESRPSELLVDDPENRSLVAVQHVNSETGNRQHIGFAAEVIHDNGGLILVDCAQSAGKFPLPRMADMAIVSAHKYGGPVGVGALLVQDYALLHPAGGQERGYRRGTENLPGVLGMMAALEACCEPYIDPAVLAPLDALAAEVRALGGEWLSDRLSDPTPFIRAIAMPRLSAQAQLMRFDMAGIAVSQGSACSSGTMKRSHVLTAMGLADDLADRTIRVSFGWTTTRPEVERFCEVWLDMARRV